jgi:exportin-1
MHHLFEIVQTPDVIKLPLWDVAAKGPNAYPDNASYVREQLINLLSTSFPNLTPGQVQACVTGMFDLKVCL